MSFSQITILGNVGKDPVIKTLDSGATLGSFSVAVSKKYKKKDGSDAETTTWFNVTCWQQQQSGLVKSVVAPHVKKGGMVFVVGEPEIQEYEKDGMKMRSFNIRVGGPGSTIRLCGGRPGNGGSSSQTSESAPAGHDPSDNIPF